MFDEYLEIASNHRPDLYLYWPQHTPPSSPPDSPQSPDQLHPSLESNTVRKVPLIIKNPNDWVRTGVKEFINEGKQSSFNVFFV